MSNYSKKRNYSGSLVNVVTPRAYTAPSKKMKVSFAAPRKKKKSYGSKGAEVKYLDTTVIMTNSVVATVASLNSLAQGLTNITRIANKIQIKSVGVRAYEYSTTFTATVPNLTRWSIVLDKEPEAAAIASYNQIYTSNSPIAWANIDNSDRFVILATGTYIQGGLNNTTNQALAAGENAFSIDTFRKCDIAAKYVGTAATQASIGSNQLLFTFVSSADDANMDGFASCRIRFTDE